MLHVILMRVPNVHVGMRLVLACLMATACSLSSAGERCLAIDGDTLVCNHRKMRLANVYAAELDEPGGIAAKRRLRSMISGSEVTIKPVGSDRYGRVLAEVFVNGRRIEQEDIGLRSGNGTAPDDSRRALLR
jgi:endonuclease YncB( thermonuclease family)